MINLPVYKEINNITIPLEIKSMIFGNCKIIVAFSGGKDSVAMVLYLLKMGIDKSLKISLQLIGKDQDHESHQCDKNKQGNKGKINLSSEVLNSED